MFNSGLLVRHGMDAGVGVGSGHARGMQFQAGTSSGSGQEASGNIRAGTADSFCRQEWNHDDNSGAASDDRADEPGDNHDGRNSLGWGAIPAPSGRGFRGAVTVDILAGTTLTIRIDQHISVKTSRAGTRLPARL